MKPNIESVGTRTFFLDEDDVLDLSSSNRTIRESSAMTLPPGLISNEIGYLCQHIQRVRASLGESAPKRLRAEKRALVSIGHNALSSYVAVDQLPEAVADLVTANSALERLQRSDRLSWKASSYLLERKLQRVITHVPNSLEQQ